MTVAAVILAAGGSTRMGRPKALLPVSGVSLLRRAVAAAVGCDPVVVVLGAAADRVRPELDGLAVTAVENPDWEQGPGTSIRVGVRAAGDADAAVFLACDQPLVDAAHICRLITAYRTGGRPMAASGYAGTVGVPAIFDRNCFPNLCALDPGAGAKKLLLLRADDVTVVPFPAGAIDLDSPDEYERFVTAEALIDPAR